MTDQFRPNSIYVSKDVYAALRMVAKAMGNNTKADDLASEVLSVWLASNHPDVVKHLDEVQHKRDEFEKALAEKLGAKLPL